MSRTYRRKHDSPPEWVTHEWVRREGCSNWMGFRIPITNKNELKKEIAKWRSDSGWHGGYSKCPGWWNHWFHEKPHRARTRNILKKMINNGNYEVLFPLHKKPHIYYW